MNRRAEWQTWDEDLAEVRRQIIQESCDPNRLLAIVRELQRERHRATLSLYYIAVIALVVVLAWMFGIWSFTL